MEEINKIFAEISNNLIAKGLVKGEIRHGDNRMYYDNAGTEYLQFYTKDFSVLYTGSVVRLTINVNVIGEIPSTITCLEKIHDSLLSFKLSLDSEE